MRRIVLAGDHFLGPPSLLTLRYTCWQWISAQQFRMSELSLRTRTASEVLWDRLAASVPSVAVQCLVHRPDTVPGLLPAPSPHSPKFQSSIPQNNMARVSMENPGQTKLRKSVWCPIKIPLMLQSKKKIFFPPRNPFNH